MARIDDERPVEDVVTAPGARAGQVASASAGVPTGQAGVPARSPHPHPGRHTRS